MGKEVTAIFDIGKTNKKFFLFDQEFNELKREYIRFDEIPDDDGFLSEDLQSLVSWVKRMYDDAKNDPMFEVTDLNVSTYGASMVHLDESYNLATPFYNYLKPFPEELANQFLDIQGGKENFELTTSSPYLGFLNSGLQLYYLKHNKPELFSKVRRSVHLPQYISSLFTGKLVSDYTSLGCHTGLWESENSRYAPWVQKEDFDELMCPIVPTHRTYIVDGVRVGVGIHDSSSAIIPYINSTDDPFVLISTGTWSISMNLFSQSALTKSELEADCLNFMGTSGLSVKAARLLLGKHLSEQARVLADHFGVDYQLYKKAVWKPGFVSKRKEPGKLLFDHSLIAPERFGFSSTLNPDFSQFDDYYDALIHLFDELTDLQIASLHLAISKSGIKRIYVDGGIGSGEVFIQFLANKLPDYQVFTSNLSLGSALGAALVIAAAKPNTQFSQQNFKLVFPQV